MNTSILSVIPIVIPIGSSNGFKLFIQDIGLFLDKCSSFLGFDVRVPIKFLLLLMLIYILVRALKIFLAGSIDFKIDN